MRYLFLLILLNINSAFSQVGIGTSTPSNSAKLEVSATDKGFLPPRIALTSTASASPISSPATGLLIYNTATAGSAPNNVIPGYYYWDGSSWNRFSTTTQLSSSTITVTATTTSPNLGTRNIDKTYAIDNGLIKTITVQLGYPGSTSGSGDYIFSLPSGVSFNTNSGFNPTLTGSLWSPSVGEMAKYFIPARGGVVQNGSWSNEIFVIPYSSTTYRIVSNNNNTNSFGTVSSTWYPATASTMFNFSFEIW